MNWVEAGKFLVIAGVVLIVLGGIFMISDKLPVGRLPGDIQIGSPKFRIYIPVATSVMLSVVVTLILNFFTRR